jgi:hypothetical protein
MRVPQKDLRFYRRFCIAERNEAVGVHNQTDRTCLLEWTEKPVEWTEKPEARGRRIFVTFRVISWIAFYPSNAY